MPHTASSMAPPTTERAKNRDATPPLVSFILLAFNQERYIDDAIEAALRQDYPNLELILSDDGSTDATFARMQRRASADTGRRILLNRRIGGAGILAHLYDAAQLASGELVIVAAGDDISLPQRVSRLVQAWQTTGADALCSAWQTIDASGNVIGNNILGAHNAIIQSWFPSLSVQQVYGATSAYVPAVFRGIALPPSPIFAEDFFFTLMLGLRSRLVVRLDEPLVRYRAHDDALTHRTPRHQDQLEYERTMAAYAQRSVHVVRYFAEAVANDDGFSQDYGTSARVDRAQLARDLRHGEFRCTWMDAPMHRRLLELLRLRRAEHIRWLLPRLFGPGVLGWLRRLRPDYRAERA